MKPFMGRLIRRAMEALAPNMVRDADLGRYARDWVLPRCGGLLDPSTYVPAARMGHLGIDMEHNAQIARIQRWATAYTDLFAGLREDPRINTQCPGKPCIHNGMFSTPDAESYAAMILDVRPRHIVEVGAGFSTLIARAAVDTLSLACRITVVDPEPRTDVAGAADTVVRARVEERGLEDVLCDDGLLLFIDSSHITRAGGDIPYLYTMVVPTLPAGTVVHVHDIFLPYDYPAEYRRRLYTEQYVLQALLADSPRYQVLLATHWLSREYPTVSQEAFGDVVGRDALYFGASLWFRVGSESGGISDER
jgi:hypothetical protein